MMRKGSIFRKPQWLTRSALLRNLKASATSANPSTTFTVFSQPPDLGRELIQPGKAANKPKGRARASPKPAIPDVSCHAPPSEVSAPARSEPKMGPVHEKETRASVIAIKKIPSTPPMPSALEALLVSELGSEIS